MLTQILILILKRIHKNLEVWKKAEKDLNIEKDLDSNVKDNEMEPLTTTASPVQKLEKNIWNSH